MDSRGHKNNVDTTAGIWDILYKVRMPYLQTTSVEYIKMFGMPSSGDKNVDKEMANQWITTYQSIASLTEHYANGVNIKVVDPSDPKRMYDAIAAHLEAWKDQIRYGINIGNAPIEDLIKLDEFANAVYEHAKYHMRPSDGDTMFAKEMSRLNPFSGSDFFRGNRSPMDRHNGTSSFFEDYRHSSPQEAPERESLGDFLKSSLNTTSRFRS